MKQKLVKRFGLGVLILGGCALVTDAAWAQGRGGFGGGIGNVNQQGRVTAPQVVATSDDRANALIVSATQEQIDLIDKLVAQVDVNVDDISEVRVFKLSYADPADTVNQLATLFPNTTTSTGQGNARGQQFQVAGAGGRGGRGGGAATATSDRMLRQTQVTAVADYRTSSVIVVASKTMMTQIDTMIRQLDSDKAGEMQMFAFPMESVDPSVVMTILQGLIPAPVGAANYRNNTTSAIFNRAATGNQGSMGTRAGGIGGGAGGFGGGGGAAGGAGGFGGSDRNIKTNFAPVDAQTVLAKVAAMPITTWNYKDDLDKRHLGPMAQDFYGAFGIGQDDKTITFLDEGGVALAAIKGLNQKLEEKDAKILALAKEVSELKALVQTLVPKSNGGVVTSPGK
jgi:hypothetical protein